VHVAQRWVLRFVESEHVAGRREVHARAERAPAPVTMMAPTSSATLARRNACSSSSAIVTVKALSASGRVQREREHAVSTR
jgi:hypothetical protein